MAQFSEQALVKWIRFSGELEMTIGIFFLIVIPWIFISVEVIFPINFFIYTFGVFIIALGATLYVSAKKLKECPFVPVISCFMRFSMVFVEAEGAWRLWNLTEQSYVISIALICGSIYDFVSAAFTLVVLKRKAII